MKIGEASQVSQFQNTIVFLKVLDKRLFEPEKIDLVKFEREID